jgi:hypothetical protein
MATLVFASAVSPVDDPETPFNEADAPPALELALPTSVGVNLVRATVDSVESIVLPMQWIGPGSEVKNSVHQRMPVARRDFFSTGFSAL